MKEIGFGLIPFTHSCIATTQESPSELYLERETEGLKFVTSSPLPTKFHENLQLVQKLLGGYTNRQNGELISLLFVFGK
jgi:hypothetical protein